MTTPADKDHPHSIFGASKASTWRTCHGAIGAIEAAKAEGKIPESKDTTFSAEGTEAHDWSYGVLSGKCGLEELPDDFRHHLTGYIAHCRMVEELGGASAVTLNESTIPLFYRPQDDGTVDHAVFAPDFLHFTDLKYGAGVKVSALENDQLMIYVISLLEQKEVMEGMDFPPELPVYITVYQPRHYSFDGDPDTWGTTIGELQDYAMEIRKDYEIAQTRPNTFKPSDKACMFCELKKTCAARAATSFGGLPPALNAFDIETDTKEPLEEFDQTTLTHGQVAWICTHGKKIKNIIDNVAEGELDRLKAGGHSEEMKVVAGKLGNRTWIDAKAAETAIRSLLGATDSYKPRSFITAPQALGKLKLIKGEMSTISLVKFGLADAKTAEASKTECLIHRPEGKPKLVPMDDKAEALIFRDVAEEFEIEE